MGDSVKTWWKSQATKAFIDEYALDRNHPHRKVVMSELERLYPFSNLLEIGCNAGPNLANIQEKWPDVSLTGIDINKSSVDFARDTMPEVNLLVASAEDLPFYNTYFDIVLCDAVLMYIEPDYIKKVVEDITKIAARAVIICDWESKSKSGVKVNFSWCRNYTTLLREHGWTVTKTPFTTVTWPNHNWVKRGALWVGTK